MYNEISNNKENVEETLANWTAALGLANKFKDAIATSKKADDNTYELTYNAACAAIGAKDFVQAKQFLDFASSTVNY